MAKAKKSAKKTKAKVTKVAKKAKSPAKKASSTKKTASKKASKTSAKKAASSKKVKPAKKASSTKKEKAVKTSKVAKTTKTSKKTSKNTKATKAKAASPKKAALKKTSAKKVVPKKEEAKSPKAKKTKKVVEVELLDEDFNEDLALEAEEAGWATDPDDIVLTDADGNPYCKAKDCDQLAAVDTYCRYHYILLWKRIQNRKKILAGGKLDRYIEELTARYPDKYLEMLRKDLASEKDFLAVVAELDIDEGLSESEFDDDSENFIDEMRGVSREEGDEEF